ISLVRRVNQGARELCGFLLSHTPDSVAQPLHPKLTLLVPYSIPTSRGTGDIDFGPAAIIELHAHQLRWFDRFLKEIANNIVEEPPVRLFVMGENRWRDENEWPLGRTRYTEMFLHRGGRANTLGGDGRLSAQRPADEPHDSFVYDPDDPVPTRGGTTLGLKAGAFDQRE